MNDRVIQIPYDLAVAAIAKLPDRGQVPKRSRDDYMHDLYCSQCECTDDVTALVYAAVSQADDQAVLVAVPLADLLEVMREASAHLGYWGVQLAAYDRTDDLIEAVQKAASPRQADNKED